MEAYDSLTTLDWLKSTPRELTPDVESRQKSISSKPAFFVFWGGGPKGWVKDMEQARLSYVYVVQANSALFSPEEASFAPAVLLATADPRSTDWRWIAQEGERVVGYVRSGGDGMLKALLEHEASSFDREVDPSVTPGSTWRMWTDYVDPDRLPGGAIPTSRVVPALNHGKHWSLIPQTLYR